MAEEREKGKPAEAPRAARKAKKAVPEAEPAPALPTPAEVKAARKADLVQWAEAAGLEAEGTVDVLRSRLLKEIEKQVKAGEPEKEKAKPAKKEAAPRERPAKEKPAKKKPGKKDEEAEAEEGEEEREEHVPRAKPELADAIRAALRLRREIAGRRPTFYRQEWYRYKRLGAKWRKPQGGQSKLRRHLGYRINVVSIGFRGPRPARGLHPSGFQEVLVHTVDDLKSIDPKRQAARIAGPVGDRKRQRIQEEAEELGVRVLNRRKE